MIRVALKSTTYRAILNKILPNFKISRFYHLKIQGKLFTIFRLTRSKNIWMDFIECEKVYSSFKVFVKLILTMTKTYNPHISMRILNSRLKHKYPVSYRVQIGKRNLLKFECIELENQINFFLNDGYRFQVCKMRHYVFFYQPFFLSELLKIQNQNYEEKI
ncbi:hypothetical protein BpHYR1_049847 [Brachionus plicatilis]|uniref:Uncharacterized protein n=1 Tax=Brachionus plicatilis TaxID=10195 RepID=A0A3M7SG76_BRAPC|nr:hypothetical protein BpHYR1_049847 [Brachionus plicatilis]